MAIPSGSIISVDYLELKRYNDRIPLNQVPYEIVRMSADRKTVHLSIVESGKTVKTIAFFRGIIENNQDKLVAQQEILPSSSCLRHCTTCY
ncbi:hypothetical protein JCM19235_1056 [Vibrio maritimus]|uniref:Uncharacterized protein n=1 Tax=Vibrio maritimus TaxID=990268 RepID=A0A090RW66_9VIBR|nr:hypothetical protein JCM19235_1056 [Vibrio maritimus]